MRTLEDKKHEQEVARAIQKYVAEAVAAERDACAKVAEAFVHTRRDCEAGTTTQDIAQAIRARGRVLTESGEQVTNAPTI